MSDEPIEITSIPCPNCGHAIPIGETYCEGCGIGEPNKNAPGSGVSIIYRPPSDKPENSSSDDIQAPPQQTTLCPHCGKPVLSGSTWCPHCGTGVLKDTHYGRNIPVKSGKYPYDWRWFLWLFLLIPLICCGGCFVDYRLAGLSFLVMVLSLIIGLTLFISNFIRGRQ